MSVTNKVFRSATAAFHHKVKSWSVADLQAVSQGGIEAFTAIMRQEYQAVCRRPINPANIGRLVERKIITLNKGSN